MIKFKLVILCVLLSSSVQCFGADVVLSNSGSVSVIDKTHIDTHRVQITGDAACVMFNEAKLNGSPSIYLEINEAFMNDFGPFICIQDRYKTEECHCSTDVRF
jgi:hypothetical protein